MSLSDAQTEPPAPDSIEGHLASGKNAAGGRDDTPDFYGLVTALCVASLNAPARPDAPAPRMNPNRASTYLEPKQAFDDLYWMGTPSRSTWALTTRDGIILSDTQLLQRPPKIILRSPALTEGRMDRRSCRRHRACQEVTGYSLEPEAKPGEKRGIHRMNPSRAAPRYVT
jgi:hypothetical protein